MKILGAIVIILVVIFAFPYASAGATNIRTIAYTQTIPTVATSGGTTANVALTKALFNSDVVYVTALTSSNTSDTPAVLTYTTSGHVLAVGGLIDNTSRTLYVTYNYQRLDANTEGLWANFDLFYVLGILAVIVAVLWTNRKSFR
jgi:hypothetical protein